MNSFVTLVEYQDKDPNTLKEGDILSIDAEDVVVGLQGFGVKPLRARSDGKKLIIDFLKTDVMEPFQRIQASLAGAATAPLLVDYNQILLARVGWKGLLTMMRNVPIQK